VKASLTALAGGIGAFVTPFAIHLLGIRGALAVLGLLGPAVVALAWHRLHAIDAAVARRDEEIEVLNGVAMFRPLPMPAIDSLALHVDAVQVGVGEDVFRQGDLGDRFYVIEDGEAEVLGDGRVIRTLDPGDGFGEIALLHDTSRTATVRARTPLLLHRLESCHFCSVVGSYESSEREANVLVLDRLDAFAPAG
jgi:hypothetical protein